MITINLLPRSEGDSTGFKALKPWLPVGVLIGVLLVAILYFWLVGAAKESKAASLSRQVTNVNNELQSYADVEKQSNQLRNQVEAVEEMLGRHVRWSNFFSLIEAVTKSEVTFSSISGTPGGEIALSGVAPNYDVVAQQVRSFEAAENITNVVLTEVTKELDAESGDESVTFSIDLTVSEKLFLETENIEE